MIYFYPYGPSNGLTNLINNLREKGVQCKRIKLYNSRFRYTPNKTVINWGASSCPYPSINSKDAVQKASNKLTTFNILSQGNAIPLPVYTTDKQTAINFLSEGKKIFVRGTLHGHSGQGITTHQNETDLPNAPLYTVNVGPRTELRLHVFAGNVIDVQQKKSIVEEPNYAIRNHHNGWIYCRENIIPISDAIKSKCIEAVSLLGLQFGAVDIFVKANNTWGIFEIN